MKTEDGRELVLTLRFPLPLSAIPELLAGIGGALEEAGFTDVALDGPDVYAAWAPDRPVDGARGDA